MNDGAWVNRREREKALVGWQKSDVVGVSDKCGWLQACMPNTDMARRKGCIMVRQHGCMLAWGQRAGVSYVCCHVACARKWM